MKNIKLSKKLITNILKKNSKLMLFLNIFLKEGKLVL